MAESDAFPSGGWDEREQRLVRDLRRMYHSEVETIQSLTRVRSRLEASSTNRLGIHPSMQHRDGLLSTLRAAPGQADRDDAPISFSQRMTCQQRTGSIASASTTDFIDVDHGWANDGTLLYVTSDGGQHWMKLAPDGSFQHVAQLDFVSNNSGWAVGATASNTLTLLKTVDGGHTWMVIPYTIT